MGPNQQEEAGGTTTQEEEEETAPKLKDDFAVPAANKIGPFFVLD
jgi:hypothetical protein